MNGMIPCNCGQSFPPARDECPYCGEPPRVSWVYAQGQLARLVEFTRDGQQLFHYDGEDYDFKSAARQGLIPPKRRRRWGFLGWRWFIHVLMAPPGSWSNKRSRSVRRDSQLDPELIDICRDTIRDQIKEWQPDDGNGLHTNVQIVSGWSDGHQIPADPQSDSGSSI